MKAFEFKGILARNGQIAVPPEVACQVPPGEQLQVVLLWGASNDDDAWLLAGRRQFEAAYAPEDSVYEQLIDETPAR